MDAIVIGAGPAGLACGACLKRQGFDVELLDRAQQVGARWRGHYESLRLHTSRGRSGLPGLAMPRTFPRYPTRAQVVDYLESYARYFELEPVFGAEIRRVEKSGERWRVTGSMGERMADVVVFATGINDRPRQPVIVGLDEFIGPVVHSSGYRNPEALPGKRVLVVGFGNSGADIALDLIAAGRDVQIVVRSPVNILPKELLGVPITSFELLTRLLPYRWADRLVAPLLRAAVGRPEDYGLMAHAKGPAARVIEDGRIPMIDTGALAAIREGKLVLRPGLERFEGQVARFVDGVGVEFDAVVLATGYQHDLRSLLPGLPGVLDAAGRPRLSGQRTAERGLYFCSYIVSANGQLKQAGREAEAIARDAAEALRRR
ncbi:flavin-containing monooxygenase [Aliiruegeria lutimaris]|uniref:Predicted flavoprotein CzcO associated with the cation diffusion facilitator CzcD n=1 Tax=Aliiruegeria lutimaris TaxID=571298 RepID=A0A1G8LTA1_9RHOB|nr:NAD(P)/FAD-dependent oxidoreductase [Aliiruegeria lutimaris]SDI58951.1 Predicted flavoprotein CzcO associated with the cation diffusion facilitator CzcD [Aliiruegeria lutimaris]